MRTVPLFQALTRPAMVFGLTYNYFALLLVCSLSITFMTKWYLFSVVLTIGLYFLGRWLVAYDPHFLEGVVVLRQYCKYQRQQSILGYRTYAPW